MPEPTRAESALLRLLESIETGKGRREAYREACEVVAGWHVPAPETAPAWRAQEPADA